MKPIVAIDTETDGLRPDRKIWDIAMIRRDETGERTTQFYVEIDLHEAEPIALQIGGFYERHPRGRYLSSPDGTSPFLHECEIGGYETTYGAALKVAQWTHGAHIIGAVPNFDTEALSDMMRREGLLPGWHYHLIDVEALALGYLHGIGRGPGMSLPWKSDDLSRAIGVEPPSETERHTALGDAEWALRMYDKIVGDA
jgi:hypothetical protein